MIMLSSTLFSRSRVNSLALTPPSLACRSHRLPSHTISRSFSLLRSAPTANIAYYQGDGVHRTSMIPPHSTRNMSSLLPSVMTGNLGATGCDLAPVSPQVLHRQGNMRFTTNSGNHKVQEEPLSEEERTQLQTEMQLLEGRILKKREEIREINRITAQTATELETSNKEIAAGKQYLDSLKNDKMEEGLDEFFPELLPSNIQYMRSRADKFQAIKDFIANQVKVRKEKELTFVQFLALLMAALAGRKALEEQLTEIRTRLQSSGNFGSSGSGRTGHEPPSKASAAYTHVTWDQVEDIFNPTHYEQPRRNIDDETMDFLAKHLSMTTKWLPFLASGKHARRLHFIAPILVCVCNLFDGDVDIVVDKDLVGNFLKAHVHFDFMLRRGNKVVCITHVKEDNIADGIAQGLLGCEVVADVEGLDIVYGVVTNYDEWSFLRSLNDKVEMDSCVLDQTRDGPKRESLKKIAEKIYSMLSS